MTKTEWHQNQTNRIELEKVLASPILKLAIEVLKEANEPSATSLTEANVTIGFARQNQNAGFFDFHKQLIQLTKQDAPKKKTVRPTPLIDDVIELNRPQ